MESRIGQAQVIRQIGTQQPVCCTCQHQGWQGDLFKAIFHVQLVHGVRATNQVAVGDYVVIPLGYRNEKIFGVIEKIQYSKRSSLDDTSEVHALVEADRIDEKEYIQTALVEPLSNPSRKSSPASTRPISAM